MYKEYQEHIHNEDETYFTVSSLLKPPGNTLQQPVNLNCLLTAFTIGEAAVVIPGSVNAHNLLTKQMSIAFS